MSELTCAGKVFVFHVDHGVVFRGTYAADGTTLHHETLEGPAIGAEETVTLHTGEVGHGLFMLGRAEKPGMTVTHLMNLNARTVHAFRAHGTGTGRVAELHTGTLGPA
ncbi:hypothetical protein MUK60_41830 [Streptomyces sp. LRE541]|uniref:MoaF-related domain-containing protein n=1 Tax=Streptomyces sp. LRE541 TaxID=2931983 RepID=UPI00200F2F3E|nr:hypothetical protein [Streptomyces sp. LRE541]UPZ33774.1 hypothetical protein MUK60_41830 [Streptomyces sp. LRE541]